MNHSPVEKSATNAPAISRRHFTGGVLASAVGALPAVNLSATGAAPQPAPFQPGHLNQLRLSQFEALIGQRFSVWTSTRADGKLLLTEARALDIPAANQHLADPDNPGFALIFERSDEHELTQDTYRLTHWRFGDVDLFLVPMKSTGERQVYEAIVQHYVIT